MTITNFRSFQNQFSQSTLEDLIKSLDDSQLCDGCDEWIGNQEYDVNIWAANIFPPEKQLRGTVYTVVDGQTDIHNIVAEFQIV